MCAVVLVTAQDLQATTLAPVETPGCEGAVTLQSSPCSPWLT